MVDGGVVVVEGLPGAVVVEVDVVEVDVVVVLDALVVVERGVVVVVVVAAGLPGAGVVVEVEVVVVLDALAEALLPAPLEPEVTVPVLA